MYLKQIVYHCGLNHNNSYFSNVMYEYQYYIFLYSINITFVYYHILIFMNFQKILLFLSILAHHILFVVLYHILYHINLLYYQNHGYRNIYHIVISLLSVVLNLILLYVLDSLYHYHRYEPYHRQLLKIYVSLNIHLYHVYLMALSSFYMATYLYRSQSVFLFV